MRGLACRRGGEWLFSDFSFLISAGQIVWIRGQNGQGKTSLLRTLIGLSEPESGEVIWHSNADKESGLPRDLLYIGHSNGLKEDLTVTEALQFLARLHSAECSKESVLIALDVMGMRHRRDALVRTLSQGQRRRVALARLALERKPSVWVLDEPLDALDDEGINTVNQLMLDHVARGGSILLSSHLPLTLDASMVRQLEFQSDKKIWH